MKKRSEIGSGKSERSYYWLLGALTLLLTSAPYVYAWGMTPPGHVFTGLIYNIDDSCVYLSWMQQAQAGHFFIHSLFSTDPQKGVLFNLFFWLLGTLVRLTHLPQIAVFHGARVICSGLFLTAVVGLIRETLPAESDARARRLGFALVCFSAGLGWLWGGYSPALANRQPIDLWQPEAISFLALYFSPLFAAALTLMVVFMTAVVRVERTRRLRDAVPAMLAGALLGNFHSYDVIPLFTVWFVYRILCDVLARRFDRDAWLRFVAVGLVALPTTAYVYWATQVEPVFRARAFVSSTPSPALRWDLLGLGLPLVLAVLGVLFPRRNFPLLSSSVADLTPLPPLRSGEGESKRIPHLPLAEAACDIRLPLSGTERGQGGEVGNGEVWGVGEKYLLTYLLVGIAIAYVPVAFQRKLLMGVEVPICILAGSGLAALTARLSGDFPKIAAFFAILLTVPSNVIFLQTDIDRLKQNAATTSYQPYLKQTEIDALNYLRDHASPTDAVLASLDASSQNRYPGSALDPYLSVYIPALAGRLVYDGHWSETGNYKVKLPLTRRFFRADTTDDFRRELLQSGEIRYVLCDKRLLSGESPRYLSGEAVNIREGVPYVPVAWARNGPPAYLKAEFENADVIVYRVESDLP